MNMPQIKHYFWLIILVVFTAILSAGTSFEYALGVISANVIRDGIILTILWFAFSYYFKNKQWAWYDWLNVLAYTTLIASFLKPILQEFIYEARFNPNIDRIIIAGVLVALVFGGLWFIKRNKTVSDSNLQPSLGFIKNEQGFTSIGKGIIALLVLALLSYPAYKVYDRIELNNLIKDSANGEAFAQTKLGGRYYYGKGVTQSYYKAIALWEKAANQGYAKAQFAIGRMYAFGRGVPQDDELGIYWITKAAEQEYSDAQALLGAYLYEGNKVEKDIKKGLYYLNRSIANGNEVAKMYKESNGIE
jgi:hypothetical protein